MKRTTFLLLCSMFAYFYLEAQIKDPKATEVWEPEPRVVTPGTTSNAAPSDAIILFDGSNLEEWSNNDGAVAGWKVENGAMTVVKGAGIVKTKRDFGSIQLVEGIQACF